MKCPICGSTNCTNDVSKGTGEKVFFGILSVAALIFSQGRGGFTGKMASNVSNGASMHSGDGKSLMFNHKCKDCGHKW